MPVVVLKDGRLNAATLRCRAEGSGPPLVLLHGLAANMGFWLQDYAPRFAERFTVYLYDMRGHGRSAQTDRGYTPAGLTDDLTAFLDGSGLDRVHLAAHSFGGVPALRLAAENPARVDSLILMDTHIALGRRRALEEGWDAGTALQKDLEACGMDLDVRDPYFGFAMIGALARLQTEGRPIPERLQPWMRFVLDGQSRKTGEKWLSLVDNTQAAAELRAEDGLDEAALRRVRCPVLALYGEHSQALATGRVLADTLPDIAFETIPGAGHFFPKSMPDRTGATCEAFWDRIGAAPNRENVA